MDAPVRRSLVMVENDAHDTMETGPINTRVTDTPAATRLSQTWPKATGNSLV